LKVTIGKQIQNNEPPDLLAASHKIHLDTVHLLAAYALDQMDTEMLCVDNS
jgi:hypothetical protein